VYDGSELTGVTEDQTWVNEVGRRLGIDEASLKTHPMRHVLTMAIGVSPEVRVHSYTLRPHTGELFLLSSDGLHGVIESGVIADKLSGNGSLQAKCERLIEAAKQAGGPDNITVVLLKAR
jgi:protein phosphatase